MLDTETTGFTGEIIELALVDRDGKTLFEERIRPHCRIEPGAMAVHKIQDGHLVGLPHLDHHWPRLRPLLLEHTVVIYNKAFDVGRLRHSMNVAAPAWKGEPEQQRDFQAFSDRAECAMQAYGKAKLGGRNGLIEACASEGVTIDDLPPRPRRPGRRAPDPAADQSSSSTESEWRISWIEHPTESWIGEYRALGASIQQ